MAPATRWRNSALGEATGGTTGRVLRRCGRTRTRRPACRSAVARWQASSRSTVVWRSVHTLRAGSIAQTRNSRKLIQSSSSGSPATLFWDRNASTACTSWRTRLVRLPTRVPSARAGTRGPRRSGPPALCSSGTPPREVGPIQPVDLVDDPLRAEHVDQLPVQVVLVAVRLLGIAANLSANTHANANDGTHPPLERGRIQCVAALLPFVVPVLTADDDVALAVEVLRLMDVVAFDSV